MELYYIIFCILAFFSFIEEFAKIKTSTRTVVILFFSILYIFLSTIYEGIQGDYEAYSDFFSLANIKYLNGELYTSFEYLYVLLNVIIRHFTEHYFVLRFVLASIVMIIWYKIYTYYSDDMIGKHSITIFTIMWAINVGNIFVVRSTVAIAICIFSLRYIERKEVGRYIVCTILATGFHTMAICWIFAYSVYYLKHKRIWFFGILTCLMLLSSIPKMIIDASGFMPVNVQEKIYQYVTYNDEMFGLAYSVQFTIAKALFNIIFLIVVFQYISVRKRRLGDIRNFDNCYNLYLAGTTLYIISMAASIVLSRMAVPFTTMQYFLLPHIFDLPEIKKSNTIKFLVFFLLLLYVFLRMYVNLRGTDYTFTTIL